MSCGCTTCDDDHVVTPEGGCFGAGKRKARRASREAVTPGSMAPQRDAPVRPLLEAAPWLVPGATGWGADARLASPAALRAPAVAGDSQLESAPRVAASSQVVLEASPDATRALAMDLASRGGPAPSGPSSLDAGTKQGGGGGGGDGSKRSGAEGSDDQPAGPAMPSDAPEAIFQFVPPPDAGPPPCDCVCVCDDAPTTPLPLEVFAMPPDQVAAVAHVSNAWSPLLSFRNVWGLGPTFVLPSGSLGGVAPDVVPASDATSNDDDIVISASAGYLTGPSGDHRVSWAGPTGLVQSSLPARFGLGNWSASPALPTVGGAADAPGAGVLWDPPNPDPDEPPEWRPWHPGDPSWGQPGMPAGPVDERTSGRRSAFDGWRLGHQMTFDVAPGPTTEDGDDGDGGADGGGGGGASRGGGLELDASPIDKMAGGQVPPLPTVEPPWTLVPAAGPSVTVPASPGPPVAVKRPLLEPSHDPARRSALISVGPGSVGGPKDPARAAAQEQNVNHSRLQALDQATRRDEYAARLQGEAAVGPNDGRYGNTRALLLDVGPEAAEAGMGRTLGQSVAASQSAIQAEQRRAAGVAPPQSGAVQIGRGAPVRVAEGTAVRPPRLSQRELSAGGQAWSASRQVLAPDVAVLDDGSAVSPSENDVVSRPAVLPGGLVGGRGTPRDAVDAAAASSPQGTRVPGDTIATESPGSPRGGSASRTPQYPAAAVRGIGRAFGPGARTTDAFRFDSLLPKQGKGGGGGGRPPGTDDLAGALAILERARAARDIAGSRPDRLAQQATAELLSSLDAMPSAGDPRAAASDRATQLLGRAREGVDDLANPSRTSAAAAERSRHRRETVLRHIALGDKAANAAHDAYLDAVADVLAAKRSIAEEYGERGLVQAEREATRLIEQDTRRQQARGAQSNAREAARITAMAAGASRRVERAVNRASEGERRAARTEAWQDQADAILGAASDLIVQGQVDQRVNGERSATSYDLMNLEQAERELASAESADGRRLAREARRRVPEHERALRAQDKRVQALDKKIAKLERQAEANPDSGEQLDAARRERDELTQQREATERSLAEDQRVARQETAARARVKQLRRLSKKSKLTRSQQRARDKALEVLSEARRQGADLPDWADAEVDAWEQANPDKVPPPVEEPSPFLLPSLPDDPAPGGAGEGPAAATSNLEPGCEECPPPENCDGPYTCRSKEKPAEPGSGEDQDKPVEKPGGKYRGPVAGGLEAPQVPDGLVTSPAPSYAVPVPPEQPPEAPAAQPPEQSASDRHYAVSPPRAAADAPQVPRPADPEPEPGDCEQLLLDGEIGAAQQAWAAIVGSLNAMASEAHARMRASSGASQGVWSQLYRAANNAAAKAEVAGGVNSDLEQLAAAAQHEAAVRRGDAKRNRWYAGICRRAESILDRADQRSHYYDDLLGALAVASAMVAEWDGESTGVFDLVFPSFSSAIKVFKRGAIRKELEHWIADLYEVVRRGGDGSREHGRLNSVQRHARSRFEAVQGDFAIAEFIGGKLDLALMVANAPGMVRGVGKLLAKVGNAGQKARIFRFKAAARRIRREHGRASKTAGQVPVRTGKELRNIRARVHGGAGAGSSAASGAASAGRGRPGSGTPARNPAVSGRRVQRLETGPSVAPRTPPEVVVATPLAPRPVRGGRAGAGRAGGRGGGRPRARAAETTYAQGSRRRGGTVEPVSPGSPAATQPGTGSGGRAATGGGRGAGGRGTGGGGRAPRGPSGRDGDIIGQVVQPGPAHKVLPRQFGEKRVANVEWPAVRGRGGAAPGLKGTAGVDFAIREAVARGWEVIARNVRLRFRARGLRDRLGAWAKGRRHVEFEADVVFYDPASRRTWALEVKTGPRARLSRAQRGGLIAAASGRARITGRGRSSLAHSRQLEGVDALLRMPASVAPEGARVTLDIVSVAHY